MLRSSGCARCPGSGMSVLDVDGFEQRLQAYAIERSEEARAVRTSVRRRPRSRRRSSLATPTCSRASSSPRSRRRRRRSERVGARGGRAAASHVPGGHRHGGARGARGCARERAARGSRRLGRGGAAIRSAQAGLAVEPDYARRALGEAVLAVSAGFNDQRRSLLADRHGSSRTSRGSTSRSPREAEKGVLLRPILGAVDRARVEHAGLRAPARALARPAARARARRDPPVRTWPGSGGSPARSHVHEGPSVAVCLATLQALGLDLEAEKGIHTDLEDRPQKSPRACVIASDPPRVVPDHAAQGGLHDYEPFSTRRAMRSTTRAARRRCRSFRRLSRDHALTEIYSFLLDSISCEPGWHAEHFGLSDGEALDNADAARFSDTLLFAATRPSSATSRLLDAVPHGRRHTRRVRGAPDRGDRDPLPGRQPPPTWTPASTRPTTCRAWIRSPSSHAPAPRGRGRLVAAPGDRGAAPRPVPRGHAADDGGDRRADRLRPARHDTAGRRADGRGRVAPYTPEKSRRR